MIRLRDAAQILRLSVRRSAKKGGARERGRYAQDDKSEQRPDSKKSQEGFAPCLTLYTHFTPPGTQNNKTDPASISSQINRMPSFHHHRGA
jgi:hypothetical protein